MACWHHKVGYCDHATLLHLVMSEGGDCDYEEMSPPSKKPDYRVIASCKWRADGTGLEHAALVTRPVSS